MKTSFGYVDHPSAGAIMSSISTALPSQTPQFQAVQASSKTDPSKTAAAAQASAQPANTVSAPSLKAQAVIALAKPPESLKTKNSDGTYGPKHTLLPPNVYNKDELNGGSSESSEAVSLVNVKI